MCSPIDVKVLSHRPQRLDAELVRKRSLPTLSVHKPWLSLPAVLSEANGPWRRG